MDSAKMQELNGEKLSFEMPEIIDITMPESLRGASGFSDTDAEETLDDIDDEF